MTANDDGKIFDSIKRALGLQPDYVPFDEEIMMHINSVMSNLTQLGVGPEDGFIIKSDTKWSDLLVNDKLENVKSYIFMRVKMLFDSSTMQPALIAAYEKMILEQEWRLTVATDPLTPQLLLVEEE